MSEERSIVDVIAGLILLYFQPIVESLEAGATGIETLLGDEVPDDVTDAVETMTTAIESIDLAGPIESTEALVVSVGQFFEAVATTYGVRLLEALTLRFVWNLSPQAFTMLTLLGVIDEDRDSGGRIDVENLKYLWDPKSLMRDEYGWGTAEFDADRLLWNLANVTSSFGAPAEIRALSDDAIVLLDPTASGAGPRTALVLPLVQWIDGSRQIAAGVELAATAGPAADDRGVVVSPFGLASIPGGPLGPRWGISFESQSGLGHVLVFRPSGVTLQPVDSSAGDQLRVTLTRDGSGGSGFDLGSGIRVRADRFELEVGVSVVPTASFAAAFRIHGLELEVRPTSGDGFVSSTLPPNVSARCDLILEWSPDEGVTFAGSGALTIRIPLNLPLGPVTIPALTVEILIGSEPLLTASAAIDVEVELGPIQATVSRLGVVGALSIARNAGATSDEPNGPIGIDVDFLPPSGVGFAVDTDVLVGGGFIKNEGLRYSGALALQGGGIGIAAIGVIATEMPDGSDGTSILVSMFLTTDDGIQLSMGFVLTGIGGLLGVNRSMRTNVLRDGLKTGLLDSIMFPPPDEIIPRAAQIISDMEATFPAEEGRFVIGPMLRFGWGTPTVITAEVGVFLDLFDPVRVALMGQALIQLPDPQVATVQVNIDVLGTVDFEKRELSFQAAVSGSSLAVFEFYGDIALMLSWGEQPEMALAVGGFHPGFDPPAPPAVFSDLRRLTVNVNYGPVVKLGCSGYLAITPNTLQFGARVDVMIGLEAVDIGIRGFMSFDALVFFSPFGFEARVGAGMTVSVAGISLADVSLEFVLAGPTPWHIRGRASVTILFLEIPIEFDETFGDEPEDSRIEATDPWPRLVSALRDPNSWGCGLPSSAQPAEVLGGGSEQPMSDDDPGIPPPLVVHPAGILSVRQNVVPFDTTLAKFGAAPVAGHDRFEIERVTLDDGSAEGIDIDIDPIDEHFARAQFEELSDSARLSLPSFELMPAGVQARSTQRVSSYGVIESVLVLHDTIAIGADRPNVDRVSAPTSWRAANSALARAAAGRAASAGSRDRFRGGRQRRVRRRAEHYAVVDAVTLSRHPLDERVALPDRPMSRMQADRALADHLRLHPTAAGSLLVVPEWEAASS